MTEVVDTLAPDDSSGPLALAASVLEDGDDLPGTLERIADARAQIALQTQHPDAKRALGFLEAANDFVEGILGAGQGDFANAARLMTSAHEGFEYVGHDELTHASEGLRLFLSGVVSVRTLDLGSGKEQLKQAQDYLSKAGRFGTRFRPLIDHIAPDQLFVAGVEALVKMDFVVAKALIEDAAQRAEAVAKKYYDTSEMSYTYFLGLAQLYRAYFRLIDAYNNLHLLSFDVPGSAKSLSAAREARRLLGSIDYPNLLMAQNFKFACVIEALSEVVQPVSETVAALLSQRQLPAIDYDAFTARIREATDEAASLGEQGVTLIHFCEQTSTIVQNVRGFHEARPAPVPHAQAPGFSPVRLFVMMPYNEACAELEDALRDVFENEPYHFQLVLARDRTVARNLFDNVKAHMRMVNGFVADITDQNPNVMLELGMTENDPFDRPVFILRGTDGREAPTDLKGRLYLEYARPQGDRAARVAALAADLREKFNDIEDIARLRRARERRSLSSRYVTTQLGRARLAMKPDEIETLQRAFPTIEELVQSDPAAIANATGFDQELARKISQAFDTKSN